MMYSIEELTLLFFTYSFLGWCGETVVATVKNKDFRNRGFVSSPFCFIYGFSGVLLTVILWEVKYQPVYLFLGSLIIATAIEWVAGKMLERMNGERWWDYSGHIGNFDGYICPLYSVIWGILGFFAVRFGNDIAVGLFELMPQLVKTILLIILSVIAVMDLLISLLTALGWGKEFSPLFRWNGKLQRLTVKAGMGLSGYVRRRIRKAYPVHEEVQQKTDEERFTLEQFIWLFVIGAFLGDIVETIFCRLRAGIWMSRSSLVWGPFSVVWGLAIACATALLYKDRNKPDSHLFLIGTMLGGAYEYACSVFTELVFGQVFWDYSEIPFNIGGRINLLYCFFWGMAAVVWIKYLYPIVIAWVKLLLKKTGKLLTLALTIFLAANIIVSMAALVRYDERARDIPAESAWEEYMDEHYGDEKMEKIYPNAIQK